MTSHFEIYALHITLMTLLCSLLFLTSLIVIIAFPDRFWAKQNKEDFAEEFVLSEIYTSISIKCKLNIFRAAILTTVHNNIPITSTRLLRPTVPCGMMYALKHFVYIENSKELI